MLSKGQEGKGGGKGVGVLEKTLNDVAAGHADNHSGQGSGTEDPEWSRRSAAIAYTHSADPSVSPQ